MMYYPICFAVKHNDNEVVANSRSGGIFTAISDYFLNQAGVIYGCILTPELIAIHIRATNSEERNQMRGSKYIQSRLGDTFKHVREDLKHEKLVLFSGTPCQIAGLRGFLGEEYKNLFCVDILCHGVPSPVVWKQYVKWQENQNGKRVIGADFRNKKDFGWRAHVETLFMDDGSNLNSEIFKRLFYGHNILRESCHVCPYKSTKRIGDISIADYWGIEKVAPDYDDNGGVSLVLINNDKGHDIFEAIKDSIHVKQTKLEDSMQNALIRSYPRPKEKDIFWYDFRKQNFSYIVQKYGTVKIESLPIKVFHKLKGIVIEMIRI